MERSQANDKLVRRRKNIILTYILTYVKKSGLPNPGINMQVETEKQMIPTWILGRGTHLKNLKPPSYLPSATPQHIACDRPTLIERQEQTYLQAQFLILVALESGSHQFMSEMV